MPTPRKALVSLNATPYYHCVSRCVRRAFLCGTDQHSGQSYEHRQQWVEEKLLFLGQVFALDICAYAVMSNHYHVVLHIDREQADSWDIATVIDHWHQLFKGTVLTQRFARGDVLDKTERAAVSDMAEQWRARLCDISWFMRVINEGIARAANAEDQCSGRFWEGRFKSQALLDEQALVACMAYVDLNPIRAKLADTSEHSDHTSVQLRIDAAQQAHSPNHTHQQAEQLLPFVGNLREPMPKGLPCQLTEYLELLDWTGRIIREDKRGAIPQNQPAILQRLNLSAKHWLYTSQHFESCFKGLVGTVFKLQQACATLGYQRVTGRGSCHLLS